MKGLIFILAFICIFTNSIRYLKQYFSENNCKHSKKLLQIREFAKLIIQVFKQCLAIFDIHIKFYRSVDLLFSKLYERAVKI